MPEEPDFYSASRRFGDSLFKEKARDISEGRDFLEQSRLADALRDAKPEFLKDGHGIRGPVGRILRTEDEPRRTDFGRGGVVRAPGRQAAFPEDERVQQTQISGSGVPHIAFILSNASTSTGGSIIYRVKVFDGKINGQFPSGMGFDNFILTPSDPGDALIYAGATFNPTSLAITSRFVGSTSAGTFPESRVESDTLGYLFWQIGFTYLDGSSFKIVNSKVGDINFELVYGALNGQPALLPVNSDPGWLDLAFE